MESSEKWDPAEIARAEALAAKIRESNPTSKLFAVRAPGRVNLIGEHTDYSGLPVLPIAIDRSTIIVAASRDDTIVELQNIDPAFSARSFLLGANIAPFPTGDWANYVKAGIQGVIDHFSERTPIEKIRGATMLIDGRVPLAAGLSSSAALTVSSALAIMVVNGLAQDSLETAQMVARSEWYVGTMAGGMDQAASMLGRHGHALLIHFDPLRVTPVKMPPGVAIIVADSMEVADKSGKVRDEYNRRVVECAIAARILAKSRGLESVRILGDVVKQPGEWNASDLVETLANAAPPRLGLAQASKTLDVAEETLRADILGLGAKQIQLDETRPLEILRRARHVLTETERVALASAALSTGRLQEMGALMNESHRSLRDDFEASTSRLDAMVDCALAGGALGARLTGAGFGGCIIALARESEAATVLARLEKDFYSKLDSAAASRVLRTVVHAGPGASVLEL